MLKRGLKNFLFGLTSLAVISSSICRKDLEDIAIDSEEIILYEEVKHYDESNIGEVSLLGDEFINFSSAQNLSKGDIIIGTSGENCPEGFSYEIVGVNSNKSFEVKRVGLERVIEKGLIKLSSPAFSNKKSQEIKISPVVLYDSEGNLNTTDDQLTLDGSFIIDPNLDMTLVYNRGLEEFELSYSNNLELNLFLEAGENLVVEKSKKIPGFSNHLPINLIPPIVFDYKG